MGLQDLTPQLRTRLGRVERTVGLFVILATLLVTAGFSFYLYHTAKRKGWFEAKVRLHTYLETAAGLKEGDPVFMLGFPVGEITQVEAMRPFYYSGNVFVSFDIKAEKLGYIWDDSKVKVATADFLGKRTLELIPGGGSGRKDIKVAFTQNKQGRVEQVWSREEFKYFDYTNGSKGFSIEAVESAALGDRLEKMASMAEGALPNILNLTNQIAQVLSNSSRLTAHLDDVAVDVRPILSNLTLITTQLKNPNGSLGDWLIPTNINSQLSLTLTNVNQTLVHADTLLTNTSTVITNKDAELSRLLLTLNEALRSVSNITSNLDVQMQSNTNLLKNISNIIVDTDDMIQGLKRHWLLRSAFKTNAPAKSVPQKKP